MMRLATVVMAAGMGTRMKSNLPKVLHPLLGKPILSYIITTINSLDPADVVVVTGHEADQVQTELQQVGLSETFPLSFVLQSPQLGTGHAVKQAQPLLENRADLVLVVPGDLPLLSDATLKQLVNRCQSGVPESPVTMLTVEVDDPRGFGRVVRTPNGAVQAIVEEAVCTPAEKAIRELNVGAYAFQADWLWQNLDNIPLSPKGEYYVTDLIGLAVSQGYQVQAELLRDDAEAIGINTRVHLAEAGQVLRQQICRKWMEAGVTIIDPATTYIDAGVVLQKDTIIYPNTHLYGTTSIGQDCVIGPNSLVLNSTIGNECEIRFSVVEYAVLENRVDIGPFAHLRKGAHLADDVHMGNFGEVKNSYLGPGTKMGHFSYLGDATTGVDVNIGAGTITCNYDGANKNHTTIGDNAFIGSDTMLVAPVKIGQNARTGAGSVVTKNVPDNTLAYGVPARTKKSD